MATLSIALTLALPFSAAAQPGPICLDVLKTQRSEVSPQKAWEENLEQTISPRYKAKMGEGALLGFVELDVRFGIWRARVDEFIPQCLEFTT